MNILITGGFGLLGSRLAKDFESKGHKVTLGSRQIKKTPPCRIRTKVALMDWQDINTLTAACHNQDVVIHAAGIAADECYRKPIDALRFNGVGTGDLAQAAFHEGVQKFIYFSTAHVYCSPLSGRIDEGYYPVNQHPYATSKLAGENVLRSVCAGTRTTCLALRISNVIGCPMDSNRNADTLIANDLCRQAMTNREIRLFSSPRVERDFISIQTFFEVLLDMCKQHYRPSNFILNIGGGQSLKIGQLARLIAELGAQKTGCSVKIHSNKHEDDQDSPASLDYRIDALRSTGISPKDISLEIKTELTRILNYYG